MFLWKDKPREVGNGSLFPRSIFFLSLLVGLEEKKWNKFNNTRKQQILQISTKNQAFQIRYNYREIKNFTVLLSAI
jgi:hypothetical protein